MAAKLKSDEHGCLCFSPKLEATLPFLIIIQAMGTNTGQISLPTEMEILERVESQDRSHPADSYILCSAPQCQCWVWTYRLSRVCQTCLGCGRTWQVSYLHNGYSFWTYVGWLHWLKNVMEKKHFAALHLGLYMLTCQQEGSMCICKHHAVWPLGLVKRGIMDVYTCQKVKSGISGCIRDVTGYSQGVAAHITPPTMWYCDSGGPFKRPQWLQVQVVDIFGCLFTGWLSSQNCILWKGMQVLNSVSSVQIWYPRKVV